jgi:TPR repeat protein
MIGELLFNGIVLKMNKSLASHYFKLSADQGHAEALLDYAERLFQGRDVDMNKSLAAH